MDTDQASMEKRARSLTETLNNYINLCAYHYKSEFTWQEVYNIMFNQRREYDNEYTYAISLFINIFKISKDGRGLRCFSYPYPLINAAKIHLSNRAMKYYCNESEEVIEGGIHEFINDSMEDITEKVNELLFNLNISEAYGIIGSHTVSLALDENHKNINSLLRAVILYVAFRKFSCLLFFNSQQYQYFLSVIN